MNLNEAEKRMAYQIESTSQRAALVVCPRYLSKRSQNCADKGGKTAE